MPLYPEQSSEQPARELLIPILQEIQVSHGYLPRGELEKVSRETGTPLSTIFGVITFYSHFRLESGGRHTIRACQGTACHVQGGGRVADTIEDHLGVPPGGTTEDRRFTFETVQCLGTCFLAPVVMVDEDYHGEATTESIRRILDAYE